MYLMFLFQKKKIKNKKIRSGKFSVFMVCEDLTFGVSLLKSTTYAQLVAIARKKFNIGQHYDIVLSYNGGKNSLHIVDDDDMTFFYIKF